VDESVLLLSKAGLTIYSFYFTISICQSASPTVTHGYLWQLPFRSKNKCSYVCVDFWHSCPYIHLVSYTFSLTALAEDVTFLFDVSNFLIFYGPFYRIITENKYKTI